jgi:LPXTG-motif cell wall-anchored protein
MNGKRILWALALGGAVGEILTAWLAPKYIVWYFDPPVEMGFSCREPIVWALGRFQTTQLVGLGVGALLGLVVLFWTRKRKASRP